MDVCNLEILYHFANAKTFWYRDIRILNKVYICTLKKIKNTYLFTLIGMSYECKKMLIFSATSAWRCQIT